MSRRETEVGRGKASTEKASFKQGDRASFCSAVIARL